MMRRPWVVGVEVPGEGIGDGKHGRAAEVVPLEWWGAPGRRHAVSTVIKAMMAHLRSPVLLVLPGSHGHAASRMPWPSVLWAATGWWLMWRRASSKGRPLGRGGATVWWLEVWTVMRTAGHSSTTVRQWWAARVSSLNSSGASGPLRAVCNDMAVRLMWLVAIFVVDFVAVLVGILRSSWGRLQFSDGSITSAFHIISTRLLLECLLCVAIASGYEEGRKSFSSVGSPVVFGLDAPHRRRAAYVGVASRWKRTPADIQSHRKSICCLAFGWCLLWPVYIDCLEGEWRWRLWQLWGRPSPVAWLASGSWQWPAACHSIRAVIGANVDNNMISVLSEWLVGQGSWEITGCSSPNRSDKDFADLVQPSLIGVTRRSGAQIGVTNQEGS